MKLLWYISCYILFCVTQLHNIFLKPAVYYDKFYQIFLIFQYLCYITTVSQLFRIFNDKPTEQIILCEKYTMPHSKVIR